ncbi:MAG: hypothetical protein UIH41_02730 [Treponemataceae bacterium]|nr:hypothetical protein [Treponemataceae bacterium]
MLDVVGKHRKETEILDIFSQIQEVKDTESIEYKKLVQKIYNPIWNWVLICFQEEDVRNAGVEIFHCIKRTILNYQENTSYIGFLYASIKNEIRHKKEKGEVSKFRMCTRDEYNRAVKLISSAQKFGKDPLSTNVQAWLAEQSGLSVEAIKDLISKYYRSQVVEEQIQIRENEEKKISIFETDAVHNNYLTPEQEVFKIEYALDDLAIIEQVFDERQERQKNISHLS